MYTTRKDFDRDGSVADQPGLGPPSLTSYRRPPERAVLAVVDGGGDTKQLLTILPGYKVYWSNGAQINTPHDIEISKCIIANLKPWSAAWNTKTIFASDRIEGKIKNILNKISYEYETAVTNFALGTGGVNNASELGI